MTKKILFLPFLQMQSGHHQVVETLMDMIEKHTSNITVKKIDLLSYTNKSLERMVTNGYLKWIKVAPKSYDVTYKKWFNHSELNDQNGKWYHFPFLKNMEEILTIENPDLIICTHGFPSNLLSQLKQKGKCHVPVINAYTDFFINSVWGVKGIEAHFLPNLEMKKKLNHFIVPNKNLVVTGIPVHEGITQRCFMNKVKDKPTILLAGGSSGLGDMLNLSEELKKARSFNFYVLCGNNKHLYDTVQSWKVDHIRALPYISSREEMNKLYETIDGIITKPGGITVSECLKKRIPIFVHSMLPGQEKVNFQYLKSKGLVFEIEVIKSLQEQLYQILLNPKKIEAWNQSIQSYHMGIEMEKPEMIVAFIERIMEQESIHFSPTRKWRSSILRKFNFQISK